VKIAVMLLNGCDPETAKALLDRAHGQLRKALALIGQRGMDAA
jgi:N-acetylmuramic acid 6-phosphate (MurNAc-6-P) etherase